MGMAAPLGSKSAPPIGAADRPAEATRPDNNVRFMGEPRGKSVCCSGRKERADAVHVRSAKTKIEARASLVAGRFGCAARIARKRTSKSPRRAMAIAADD